MGLISTLKTTHFDYRWKNTIHYVLLNCYFASYTDLTSLENGSSKHGILVWSMNGREKKNTIFENWE